MVMRFDQTYNVYIIYFLFLITFELIEINGILRWP